MIRDIQTMLKIITRALFALFLLFFLSIWIIQKYTLIPQKISHSIIAVLEKEWKTTINIEKCNINFFTFSIHFYKGDVNPTDEKKYRWSFSHAKAYLSPLKMLLGDPCNLYLTFDKVIAKTNYQNKQADLVNHIKEMFSPRLGKLNIFPHSIIINNFDVTIEHAEHVVKANCIGRIITHYDLSRQTPYLKKHWFGSITLSDGTIEHNDIELAAHLNSLISFSLGNNENGLTLSHSTDFISTLLDPNNRYNLEGEYNAENKELLLTNYENTLELKAQLVSTQHIKLAGHIPLKMFNQTLHGACNLNTLLTYTDKEVTSKGVIKFSDMKAAGLSLQDVTFNLTNKSFLKNCSTPLKQQCQGITYLARLSWNIAQSQGSATLVNTSPLSTIFKQNKPTTPAFIIDPGAFLLHSKLNARKDINGSYKCCITQQSSEKKYHHVGNFKHKNTNFSITGKGNTGIYSIAARLNSQPSITKWLYKEKEKIQINLLTHKKNKSLLEGTINWSLIQSFLSNHLNRLLSGNTGSFMVALDQHNLDHLKATVSLHDGQFYIPGNYNLITGIHTNLALQFSKKQIELSHAKIELSKGTVTCKKATCTFTDDYDLDSINFPICLKHVFVNWNRDFYGIFEGNLLLNKELLCVPQLTGNLILKKAIAKDNLFKNTPSSFYNPLGSVVPITSFPIGLNLSLKTKSPIKAHSDDFKAEATVDLAVKCTPQQAFGQIPYIVGTINLKSGSVKLLNQRLDIIHGTIQFLENKVNDPLIDIVAQNRVNKYHVQLQVSGSLLQPTILLESTPELSEEQIIGLLCSGSENSTLKSTVSSLIIDQLKELITKSNNKKSTELFDKLSKPFQYIQITPNIDVTSGKVDGLKGSISVNVNDQIRAEIQKNLSLDDKFSAQVEYLVSDDINIKVVKDHHGELGSELEVRLKL